ncbi:MAG TPA: type II toxin-antitoxin system Phd/YefM family antitoxin [Spirochaetota bacterium]|nr:type II toxin-antitoxin system Phd/YefM family antitoxin [Spirochaetota bacterium]
MLIETKRMIPVTKLQKELTKQIRDVSNSGEPLYILKNNNMEAVILPIEEYEILLEAEDIIEQFEINDIIEKRLKNYNPSKNIKWEDLINER